VLRVGIAADHGGFELKSESSESLRDGLIHDVFFALQGVEDDDMNILCLGGKVIGPGLALELVETFLKAHFSEPPRHQRRLAKIKALETGNPTHDDQHPHP
jgi:ribose 5-phosphate isomerase B